MSIEIEGKRWAGRTFQVFETDMSVNVPCPSGMSWPSLQTRALSPMICDHTSKGVRETAIAVNVQIGSAKRRRAGEQLNVERWTLDVKVASRRERSERRETHARSTPPRSACGAVVAGHSPKLQSILQCCEGRSSMYLNRAHVHSHEHDLREGNDRIRRETPERLSQ
jgi:hypothetical protein